MQVDEVVQKGPCTMLNYNNKDHKSQLGHIVGVSELQKNASGMEIRNSKVQRVIEWTEKNTYNI